MNSRDVEAIRDTFRQMTEACERMDAEGALNVFASDDDVLLVGSEDGEGGRGRDGIAAFLNRVLPASGGYSWDWESMLIDGNGSIAWVFAEGFAQAGSGPGATRVPYRASVVLEKRNGQWKWLLFHGSEPA